MFYLSRPTVDEINAYISRQQQSDFSYREVGHTLNGSVNGYTIDHNRIKLGVGAEIFELGRQALKRWQMFQLGWVEPCWPHTPIEVGATVAVLVNHFGFWSLNPSKIVYTIDETGPNRRYGFAYGTLPDHGECGEERFMIELNSADNSVWYDLYAFSRPRHWMALLGYPISRLLQKRFARDSKQAMARAVRS